jgi:Periplasmic copper-binding protein (NosD)
MKSTMPQFPFINRRNAAAFAALTLISALNSPLSTCLAQGGLTPPGAPGSMMRTLQQVEPRVPIETLSGNTGKYDIIQPGSYYLTTNIVMDSSHDGISIQTSNVTVDLNGFTIIATTNRSGVSIPLNGVRNIRVFGGRVMNCLSGVNFGLFNSTDCTLENLEIECAPGRPFRYGITANDRTIVRHCKITGADGSSSYAISIGSGSVVEDCLVRNCSAGVFTGSDTRVERCTVTGCIVDLGIQGQDSCIIRNNIVDGCHGGIRVQSISFVTDNIAHNSVSNDSGIYCAGSYNYIERNVADFNGRGILTAPATTNFVVQNLAHGNPLGNYTFSGTTVVAGPLVTDVGLVTNHPWANFGF